MRGYDVFFRRVRYLEIFLGKGRKDNNFLSLVIIVGSMYKIIACKSESSRHAKRAKLFD